MYVRNRKRGQINQIKKETHEKILISPAAVRFVLGIGRTNVTSDSRAVLGGQVQLTKTESEDITIIVEVWDGNRDIGRTTVTIPAGASYAGFSMTRDNNGIEPNKTYQLAISSATCQ